MPFMYADKIETLAREKHYRAMVIEDEPVVAGFLVEMLKELGFVVERFDDGMHGAARICRQKFDLLVLNWDSEDSWDGKEILDSLSCAEVPLPKVVVVFDEKNYSVSTDTDILITGFLFKPFTAQQVVDQVWKVVNGMA